MHSPSLADLRHRIARAVRHVIALALLPLVLFAAMARAAEPPPKLAVVIVVDQFSADLFVRYRGLYRHGLATLASGAVFPNAYQSHALTETCPGHATVMTGVRPARHGIVANDWQENGVSVSCVHDAQGKVSPEHLLVGTLGDLLKTAAIPSRTFAIAGKDRGAVMMGGKTAELTLWWTEKGFITYDDSRSGRIPPSISDLNEKETKSFRSTPRTPRECRALVENIEVGHQVVGKLLPTTDFKTWRASPALDQVTARGAIQLIEDLKLGRGPTTDILAISFSGTDYVGHRYGPAGVEMCAQQLSLDEAIGKVLKALDRTGVPYVVALTADHGGLDLTERNRLRSVRDAQRVPDELSPQRISDCVRKALAPSGIDLPQAIVTGEYFTPNVYFSRDIPPQYYQRVLETVAGTCLKEKDPRVAKVLTPAQLANVDDAQLPPDEWSIEQRVKAGFHPGRSGDLFVILQPHVTLLGDPDSDPNYLASHGTPWDYDRRVPMMFWWRGIQGFEQPEAIEAVDLVPTLIRRMHLDVPVDGLDGRCQDVFASLPDSCNR